jgi:hypothetical protein
MAKCIRIVGQGVPVRMSDEDAFQVVERDHDGEYCSKAVWRSEGARIKARLVGRQISAVETLGRNLQHKDGGRW